MSSQKLFISLATLLFAASLALAQEKEKGVDRVISDLNLPGEWKELKWSTAPGRIAVRPEAPDALSNANPPVTKSLGVKVDWPGGEGMRFFSIKPADESPIPQKVKTIKLWMNGSDSMHHCEIILSDANGERQKIGLGKTNFTGWKQLKKNVPGNFVQPLTITGITLHDWGNPEAGETTVYLTRLEVTVDPDAELGGAKGDESTDGSSGTDDNW